MLLKKKLKFFVKCIPSGNKMATASNWNKIAMRCTEDVVNLHHGNIIQSVGWLKHFTYRQNLIWFGWRGWPWICELVNLLQYYCGNMCHNTAQMFETYMKVKSCTGAVVISSHCKHNSFAYIKYTVMHCIISQFHTNIKATASF